MIGTQEALWQPWAGWHSWAACIVYHRYEVVSMLQMSFHSHNKHHTPNVLCCNCNGSNLGLCFAQPRGLPTVKLSWQSGHCKLGSSVT